MIIDLLKDFIASKDRNRWLETASLSVYVRKSKRILNGELVSALDLATFSAHPPGQKAGTNFIIAAHDLNPYRITFIESILNERFYAHLLRAGWLPHSIPLCLYKEKMSSLVEVTKADFSGCVEKDGKKIWYKNGVYHREDEPAVEFSYGRKEWWYNGNLHRTNGLAIEYHDGGGEFWVEGVFTGKEVLYHDGTVTFQKPPGTSKMTVEQAFKVILDDEVVNRLGYSMAIVLDDAKDFPIVLAVHDSANDEPDEEQLFANDDVRFEVSNGLPGERSGSHDYKSFHEAAEKAISLQNAFVR